MDYKYKKIILFDIFAVAMEFRTKISIEEFVNKIDYSQGGLSVGSCFAENIAARLRAAKFRVDCNPFGVMFNPVSVAGTIGALAAEKRFSREDLVREGDLWCSFAFHGSFSSVYADEVLSMMNDAVQSGGQALAEADYIILTFGTAWVYELAEGFADDTGNYIVNDGNKAGQVVANCHKFPASAFVRRRLTVAEIITMYDALLGHGGVLGGKNVILTVSPVRHVKDGLAENNLSKATLLLATDELAKKYDNVSYFPAFEIVNDELRDYRFYAADMVHPSDVAVGYIWEKFCGAALSDAAARTASEVEKITAAAAHRPLNPDSGAYYKFMDSMLAKARELQKANPEIYLGPEIEYFSNR